MLSQDFSQLSTLIEVIYALLWAMFYSVLFSIPLHAVSQQLRKAVKEEKSINYFPEEEVNELSYDEFMEACKNLEESKEVCENLEEEIKETENELNNIIEEVVINEANNFILSLSYNELRKLASQKGIKFKRTPKKTELIERLSI